MNEESILKYLGNLYSTYSIVFLIDQKKRVAMIRSPTSEYIRKIISSWYLGTVGRH